MESKISTDMLEEARIKELVSSVEEDFKKRQKERLSYERQWELNMNFLNGNQYYGISGRGELVTEEKNYFWQNRGVFNHIAPIMESRLSKLARVTPTVSIRPRSDDDKDVNSAYLAEKLLESAFKNADFNQVAKRVTVWSETCGTGFYKIVWNNDLGGQVGNVNGENVYEGDVSVISVSPFEIFPDNLYTEKLENCGSIIHAKAIPSYKVKEIYGVNVNGTDIDVYDLSKDSERSNGKKGRKTVSDSVVVIEKYQAPTEEYPNGRLITVADGKLLYLGDLPYYGKDKRDRKFPFVKQESMVASGCFFGSSIIERLIPVQKAYNAVKNRKHEFLNRLSNGVMTVEDGSLDVDDLAGEGLPPGKILVYRQGSKAPEMMTDAMVPPDFSDEEKKLLNEFVSVSGVSDVSSSSENAKLSSGSALQILISQDNERLTANAEIIRNCYLECAKHILRLYYQFTSHVRVVKALDTFDRTKIYYVDKKVASSNDVYIEGENELLYTPTQKKEMILNLYNSGLLSDENGKVSIATKEKVLSLIGYKDLDGRKGLTRLQEEKAQNENERIRKEQLPVEEIDEHSVHINEHIRYVLSEYSELKEEEKQRFFAHVKEHKEKMEIKTED